MQKTSDGSLTLFHTQHQEIYHSKHGAHTESKTVFLNNARVLERLNKHLPTRVLEIGFGSGFNFVCTAQHAIGKASQLHYTGIEINPPPADLASELLHHNAPEHPELCAFTADMLSHTGPVHDLTEQGPTEQGSREQQAAAKQNKCTVQFNSHLTLCLIHADAKLWPLPENSFDAIYLDAFSVKNNPDLWQTPFLKKLCAAIKPHGILATYCVSRVFRDALTEAGFSWQKHAGPHGKREVLTASPTI